MIYAINFHHRFHYFTVPQLNAVEPTVWGGQCKRQAVLGTVYLKFNNLYFGELGFIQPTDFCAV
jgi:hypothetical protein